MKRLLLEGPAVEPVTLAEAKAHVRVDADDEDDLLGALIVAARVSVETEIRRVMIEQSWRATRRDLAGRRAGAAGAAGAGRRGGAGDRRRRCGDDARCGRLRLRLADGTVELVNSVTGAGSLRDRFHRWLRRGGDGRAAAAAPGDPHAGGALVRAPLGREPTRATRRRRRSAFARWWRPIAGWRCAEPARSEHARAAAVRGWRWRRRRRAPDGAGGSTLELERGGDGVGRDRSAEGGVSARPARDSRTWWRIGSSSAVATTWRRATGSGWARGSSRSRA